MFYIFLKLLQKINIFQSVFLFFVRICQMLHQISVLQGKHFEKLPIRFEKLHIHPHWRPKGIPPMHKGISNRVFSYEDVLCRIPLNSTESDRSLKYELE